MGEGEMQKDKGELEPVLTARDGGLEWAVKYADRTANRIFSQEGDG